jgi:hypothetical protein
MESENASKPPELPNASQIFLFEVFSVSRNSSLANETFIESGIELLVTISAVSRQFPHLKGLINRSGPVWPQAILLKSRSFNKKIQGILLAFNSMR